MRRTRSVSPVPPGQGILSTRQARSSSRLSQTAAILGVKLSMQCQARVRTMRRVVSCDPRKWTMPGKGRAGVGGLQPEPALAKVYQVNMGTPLTLSLGGQFHEALNVCCLQTLRPFGQSYSPLWVPLFFIRP